MKPPRPYWFVILVILLTAAACSSPGQIVEESNNETSTPGLVVQDTPAPSPSATHEPVPTATPEPSPTATLAILPLEIVEWAEYPYANLADPNNTDTRVEALIRNPNDFPVRLIEDQVEVNFLAEDGQLVYSNPNPQLFIWEGSWMLGGETVALSVCACFMTDGVQKQAWSSLKLSTEIEPAPEIKYTNDVDVSIGEFISLEDAHLGGDMPATSITLVNTSNQVLKSFEVRITARDLNGKYVGVPIYGSFGDHDSNGNSLDIKPGASADGIIVSEIDYFNEPMVYQVEAIGIPADE